MRMPSWETAPTMLLCSTLREDHVLGVRPECAEHRGPEQEAGKQLPHDGRLPHSLHDLAHEPPDRKQEDDLHEEDHLRGSRFLRFGGEDGRGGEERQREHGRRAQPVSRRGSRGTTSGPDRAASVSLFGRAGRVSGG